MFLLKSCPRCRRGDLILEEDEWGRIVTCLQCGYVRDLPASYRPVPKPALVRTAA